MTPIKSKRDVTPNKPPAAAAAVKARDVTPKKLNAKQAEAKRDVTPKREKKAV